MLETVAPGKSKNTTFVIVIDRIRFVNEEVTIFSGHDETQPFAPIICKMQASGKVGQRWAVGGRYVTHQQYGPQFEARFAALAKPRNDGELSAFLNELGWEWRTVRGALAHLQTLAAQRSVAEGEADPWM